MYKVYTDGAYSPRKDVGGIGFVILNDKGSIVAEFNKSYTNTTNQRMEQMAVIQALKSITVPSEIEVYSDSAYVVETYNSGWKRNCNNDLWATIDLLLKFHKSVKFIHVRGHNGDDLNERCDRNAKAAIERSSYVKSNVFKLQLIFVNGIV